MRIHRLSMAVGAATILATCVALTGCFSDNDNNSFNATPTSEPCSAVVDSIQVNEMCVSTTTVSSPAKAAQTPGTAGVVVSNPKLITQLGADADLNQARYTRYALADQNDRQPDAILVAVPGTLGSAHNYFRLAENLMVKAKAAGMVVEVWGFDRRSTLLEDTVGLNIAEDNKDAKIALDFLYGNELDLELSPKLDRRAVFYEQEDVPFMVNWTPQVHSQDIDVVVELARKAARNGNVFLAGHSAGTGFVARYAATDFNFSGMGAEAPGYAKLRGLVLLEGQGGELASEPSDAQLDAVEAAADGGLYAAAQAGKIGSYIAVPGLTPRLTASTEVLGMQMAFEGTINGTQDLLQQSFGPDRNGKTNSVYQQVPGVIGRPIPVTAGASGGVFLDDDNQITPPFIRLSMGALGSQNASGLFEWLDNDQPLPDKVFTDNGPAPTTLLTQPLIWGVEVEPVNLKRIVPSLFVGDTNFSDWYYPSTGLLIANNTAVGGANLGLDTSKLSLPVAQGGRGRADIVNQTQARKINIPVIGFGGTNGLTPVSGLWRGFANAIAPCVTVTCNGTPRMSSGAADLSAFPTYGGPEGGFEVHLSEGYAHLDVITADDDATNNVIDPLLAFIKRNAQ